MLCGSDSNTFECTLAVIAVGEGSLADVDALCCTFTAGDSGIPLRVSFSGAVVTMETSCCVVGTDVTLTELGVLTDRLPFLAPNSVLSGFSEFKLFDHRVLLYRTKAEGGEKQTSMRIQKHVQYIHM